MENYTIEQLEQIIENKKEKEKEKQHTEQSNSFIKIGKNYFFRTVSYHLLGTVIEQNGKFVKLEKASWIADSGRFANFIKNGEADEVEPVGTVYLNLDVVVDFYEWQNKLLTEQK